MILVNLITDILASTLPSSANSFQVPQDLTLSVLDTVPSYDLIRSMVPHTSLSFPQPFDVAASKPVKGIQHIRYW